MLEKKSNKNYKISSHLHMEASVFPYLTVVLDLDIDRDTFSRVLQTVNFLKRVMVIDFNPILPQIYIFESSRAIDSQDNVSLGSVLERNPDWCPYYFIRRTVPRTSSLQA